MSLLICIEAEQCRERLLHATCIHVHLCPTSATSCAKSLTLHPSIPHSLVNQTGLFVSAHAHVESGLSKCAQAVFSAHFLCPFSTCARTYTENTGWFTRLNSTRVCTCTMTTNVHITRIVCLRSVFMKTSYEY